MNIKDLVNKAKETENQSEATSGGDFEYTPPPAGKTFGRFIEYIELGKQPQTYEGKEKPASEEVRVTFELLNPTKNIKEIDVDGGKKKIADRISIIMPKKSNEKAKFFKLFKAMAAGRSDITHMAEMLNECFIFDVKHNKSADGKKTYANLYADGTWFVYAPRHEDPLAGTVTDISSHVPEASSPLKIFLWSNPTKETWDSLFIDGTTEVKHADGTVEQRSKNWLQEMILSATDFGGSALEQLINGLDNLPTENKTVEEVKTEQKQQANLPADTQVVETKQEEPKAEKSSADLLAEIGL